MVDKLLKEIMDQMSLDDLYSLNREVIHRIRMLQAANNRRLAVNFEVGDRVAWKSRKGMIVNGIVERVNQKTLSVNSDSGTKWRVALSLCRKVS